MWKIESKDPMGGGVVSWGNPVRLKHLRYFFLTKIYILIVFIVLRHIWLLNRRYREEKKKKL